VLIQVKTADADVDAIDDAAGVVEKIGDAGPLLTVVDRVDGNVGVDDDRANIGGETAFDADPLNDD